LLVATLADIALESLDQALAISRSLSPEEAIKALVKDRLRMIRAHLEQIQIMFQEARFYPEVREQFMDLMLRYGMARLKEWLDGIDGSVLPVPVPVLLATLIGTLFMILTWTDWFGRDFFGLTDEEIAHWVAALITHGLLVDKGAGA
jgi:hypothetical protein